MAFKDKSMPTVYGVGMLGIGPYNYSTHTREYGIWKAMLQRCYLESTQIRQPAYVGVTVEDRWHNFQNFCEDLPTLEGYSIWLKDTNYQLDKDLSNLGSRIYSKNNCKFVSKQENLQVRKHLRYVYKVKAPNGEVYEVTNVAEFAKKHLLHKSHFGYMLKGKGKTCKGWKLLNRNETKEYIL